MLFLGLKLSFRQSQASGGTPRRAVGSMCLGAACLTSPTGQRYKSVLDRFTEYTHRWIWRSCPRNRVRRPLLRYAQDARADDIIPVLEEPRLRRRRFLLARPTLAKAVVQTCRSTPTCRTFGLTRKATNAYAVSI